MSPEEEPTTVAHRTACLFLVRHINTKDAADSLTLLSRLAQARPKWGWNAENIEDTTFDFIYE